MYDLRECPMHVLKEVVNVLSYLYSWIKLDEVKILSARLSVIRLKLRYSQCFGKSMLYFPGDEETAAEKPLRKTLNRGPHPNLC